MHEQSRRTILVVHLDTEQSEQIMLTEVQAHRTLSGRLLALNLWQHYKDDPGLESAAYEAGNPVVIAPGVASELGLKTPPSYVVVTRNPTTGAMATAVGSSSFGRGVLGCGYLAVVLVGRMRRLGAVLIDEAGATFTSAESYHNRGTTAVRRAVEQPHLMVTGPAAEQYSPYASLSVNGENIGEGGMGSVLGRKNVKYIAVSPAQEGRECGDIKGLSRYNRCVERRIKRSKGAKSISLYGDVALIRWANTHGWAAIEGWTHRIDGRLWALTDKVGLLDQPITLAQALALGPNLGLFEVDAIDRLARRCLDNGLDPTAVSALLAWARPSRQEGLLPFLPDLRHPDVATIERLLDSIAYKRGIGGGELAQPLDELVRLYGGAQHAYLVGKRPIPAFDLRALPATALLTALGDGTIVSSELTGGNRHRRGNERGLARRARFAQVLSSSAACVGVHPNALIDLTRGPLLFGKRRAFLQLARVASLAEGRTVSISQIIDYGRSALELEEAINEHLGATVAPHLPERPLIDGKSHYPKSQVVPLARLLDAYRLIRATEKQQEPSETR